MNYKERLREYIENDEIYTEYKSGKCHMSDFDKFCIEHCKDIECLLNENEEQKEVINKAIEFINREIEIIKEQPSENKSIDEYVLAKYNGLLKILKEVE